MKGVKPYRYLEGEVSDKENSHDEVRGLSGVSEELEKNHCLPSGMNERDCSGRSRTDD